MFWQDGKIQTIIHKTLLPTYDVFDEYRWFESNRVFECVEVKGVKIALTVCEDLWNMDDDPLYTFWPMKELIREQPKLMVNIAASPFNVQHAEDRKAILLKNVKEFQLPLIYVNQVGAQTDLLFDGGSLIYQSDASLFGEMAYFNEEVRVCEFDVATSKFISGDAVVSAEMDSKIARIHSGLVMGIRDYFPQDGLSESYARYVGWDRFGSGACTR
jgi:NAD+ synthase (glutamine-hydrolysing)